mmetsp:Transcript_14896/g.24888  ORF Transcript_14896/g.24888 Transcript_14896/m.24888 type:complete len:95 (+) Transcript_14896:1040-1324(+)
MAEADARVAAASEAADESSAAALKSITGGCWVWLQWDRKHMTDCLAVDPSQRLAVRPAATCTSSSFAAQFPARKVDLHCVIRASLLIRFEMYVP